MYPELPLQESVEMHLSSVVLWGGGGGEGPKVNKVNKFPLLERRIILNNMKPQ